MQDQLLDLILITEENGIKVEVFTDLTLLTKGIANLFKQHNARVATSLYASKEQLYDSITTVKGSFAGTVEGIRELVSADIPLRIGVIAVSQNENNLNETIRFAKEELRVGQVRVARVLGTGRACSVVSDDFHPSVRS